MKYFFLPIMFLAAWNMPSFAQPGRTIRIKAGEDAAQAYSSSGFYRFPQFSKAVLYFEGNGRRSDVLFNYNLYSGRMQFINPRGDTLDLVNTLSPDSILFEKTVFIYDGGFLEVMAQADSLKLAKKVVLRAQAENIGAYGQPNPTGSISNIRNITVGAAVYTLIVNQDIVVTEDINWYFVKDHSGAVKANKTNFLKLLPANKQARAQSYLKQHKINFERESDLRTLMEAVRS